LSPSSQQPQGFHQQHLVSGQLQGMAHRTALHPMAAPGVVPQGAVGQPGAEAGPSQGFAGAVAGAGAQEWQKESVRFTTNARSVPSATLCLCTHLMVWLCTKSRCMYVYLCMYMYEHMYNYIQITHDTVQYNFAFRSKCVAYTINVLKIYCLSFWLRSHSE